MCEPAAENVGVSRDMSLIVCPLPFSNAPTASKQSHVLNSEMGVINKEIDESTNVTKNGHFKDDR